MEATRIMSCAFFASLAGYLGIGVFQRQSPGFKALFGRVVRSVRHATERIGYGRLAASLLEIGPVARLCDEIVQLLARRGYAFTREASCGMLIMAMAASTILCMAFARSALGLLVSLGAWVVGLPLWDASLARRRARDLASEMPGVFRTLAMAMGAGETLAQAIEYVGDHEGGRAGAAFKDAALKLRCGISAQEALGALVEDLDAPGVSLLATALLISQRTGSPLRGLFRRSAQLVERQGEFERMLAVKTAQVRLSVRIVSLLPLVMIGVLSLISPDFQRGLLTVAGAGSVGVAAVMDGLALLIIRRLMRGVL